MISLIFRYIWFWLSAKNAHGIHSPFVFELYTQVIEPKKRYYAFDKLDTLRMSFLQNNKLVTINDLGAGSKTSSAKQKTISHVVRSASVSTKKGELLFKLVDFFCPKTIIELGTSLGISTLYMAEAADHAQIYTFEGCAQLAAEAKMVYTQSHTPVELILGNIDETLPQKLAYISTIDFVFIDANHQKEAVLRYFEQCLTKSHEDTVIVIDDIRWSTGMEEAWQTIKNHEKVRLSIDLFAMGLVFFRKKQPKQDFSLRF